VLVGLGLASLVLLTVVHQSGAFSIDKTGNAAQRITRLYVVFCCFWFVACTSIGWIRRARGKRAPLAARTWPLYAPLIACALAVGAIQVLNSTGSWPIGVPAGLRPKLWITVIFVAWPLLPAAYITFFLAIQTRQWKERPDPSATCPVCRYNLQGNQSGRCPECGTPVEHDATIPREFFKLRGYLLYPELSEFPTAATHYAVLKKASRDEGMPNAVDILMFLAVSAVVACNLLQQLEHLSSISMLLLIPFALLHMLCHRRRMRRRLRRYLAESQYEAGLGQ